MAFQYCITIKLHECHVTLTYSYCTLLHLTDGLDIIIIVTMIARVKAHAITPPSGPGWLCKQTKQALSQGRQEAREATLSA